MLNIRGCRSKCTKLNDITTINFSLTYSISDTNIAGKVSTQKRRYNYAISVYNNMSMPVVREFRAIESIKLGQDIYRCEHCHKSEATR